MSKNRDRILVEYSTKYRARPLSRSLAGLLDQSFQDWDLLIVNDEPNDILTNDQYFAHWIEKIKASHEVWAIDGSGIDQAHNHNIPLWQAPWRDYDLILRMDDDIIPNRYCVEEMVRTLEENCDVAAVGGLWFERERHEWLHDRLIVHPEQWAEPKLDGKCAPDIASNWPQRVYHFSRDNKLMPVEHIYSACLYRAAAMRRVGGWPEIYTKGVAHGEETDGTYRLHLAGFSLVINPKATGQHLKAAGGIRASRDVGMAQFIDTQKWIGRYKALQTTNFKDRLSVGVWCQHPRGLGGAQRLFYHTVHLLQQIPDLVVYPIFHGDHLTPEQVEEAFGITYQDLGLPPEELDVLLTFAHDIKYIQRARAKVTYTFYPDVDEVDTGGHQAVLTLSHFSAGAIARKWGVAADVVYPPIKPIAPLEKKPWIVCSGRMDAWKAPLWLMEQFADMELEGWELHVIGSTTLGAFLAYEDQCRKFAASHKNIVLHEDISQAELEEIFGHASILWAARGMYAEASSEIVEHEYEHFGYTPVEAMSAGCIPLAFDGGGHKETVPDGWRWKSGDQLRDLTLKAISEYKLPFENKVMQFDLSRFSEEEYLYGILRAIYMANAGTIELQRCEKKAVGITTRTKILGVSDTPRRKPDGTFTGFGLATREIYKGFVDAGFDVHVVARYDPSAMNIPPEYGSWWRCTQHDYEGNSELPYILSQVSPDVMFVQYDPGSLSNILSIRDMSGRTNLPTIGYFPIEGTPISPNHVQTAKRLTHAVCYTKFGADALMAHDQGLKVLYARLGLDHGDFHPLNPDDREMLRRLVGWQDRFVIGAVATNKRTKMWPYMCEIAAKLKERGHNDIIAYCHTDPEPIIGLQGHPLAWNIERLGVGDVMRFPLSGGAPYSRGQVTIDDLRKYSTPPMPEQRQALFGMLPMAYRYSMLDVYLDISSVEGFGLPIGESLMCGTPAICTHDYGAKDEVYADGVYWTTPKTHDWWHTGTRLWLADLDEIVKAVEDFKRSKSLRQYWAETGRKWALQYKWDDVRTLFVSLVKEGAWKNQGR